MFELSGFFEQSANVLRDFNFWDMLDIVAVSFLVYHLVRIMRETRAMQLVKGIGGVFAVYLLATLLGMNTLAFIIRYVIASGIILIAVLFQPELRRALEQMGRSSSKLGTLTRRADSREVACMREMIVNVTDAVTKMSSEKVGALIVLERETKLGEIIKTGTLIDAAVTSALIQNIFFHNAPLHDGAMIIREARLHAAGCFLPLSENMEIGRDLGTRHRAALGMSENSDAVVIIVSEETGKITTAIDGKLTRGISESQLKKTLTANMIQADETEKIKEKKKK